MNITVFYVGSSLLAPLKEAEREIEQRYEFGLRIAAYNLGAALDERMWADVERDVAAAEIVFVIHVTDGENAVRLLPLLARYEAQHRAVVVFNCMPELMRRTRMGRLRFGRELVAETEQAAIEKKNGVNAGRTRRLVGRIGGWMGESVRRGAGNHAQYLRYVERMPALLRFVPSAGRLRDLKHYLYLFCYFLQPTPANIRAMLLYALKHYAAAEKIKQTRIEIAPPETMPAVGIYHPDAPALFKTFAAYRKWHDRRARAQGRAPLAAQSTIGLLLMRPQIVSGARAAYDGLIRAIEAEGLHVLPAISTFMDNREACAQFFMEDDGRRTRDDRRTDDRPATMADRQNTPSSIVHRPSAISQLVSLTGFSFVGGPAMNDSAAAVEFLRGLNVPFRSAVSLDVQTIEAWRASWTGLNPVQAGMQIAIPEIDGATEPFVYGGMSEQTTAPVPLADRCRRIARRLKRWQHLQTAPRKDVRLALVTFCFPPNKGNIGTAADLDVFSSICATLARLRAEGYQVELPASADDLRAHLLVGNSDQFAATTHVAYRMSVDEYRRLCPYVSEIEAEWGTAPGALNSFGGTLLIQGLQLGNVFIAVQPTFGYEGDPMRLLMARSGAPHHGFAALYTFIEKVFRADAVVHVGTHGALEFMPGKQVGLSAECWPDRLIGELPHLYLYSVNNPSEGTIARRRSYAELISYLTPPVADAGLYRDLAAFKELLLAYRQSANERERALLYESIVAQADALHLEIGKV